MADCRCSGAKISHGSLVPDPLATEREPLSLMRLSLQASGGHSNPGIENVWAQACVAQPHAQKTPTTRHIAVPAGVVTGVRVWMVLKVKPSQQAGLSMCVLVEQGLHT